MKRIATTVAFLSFSAFAASLSIDDAIAIAKEKNPQIVVNKTHLEKAESQKTSARSLFMPQLTLAGKVTKINDPIMIDLTPVRTAIVGSNYASTYASVYGVTAPTAGEATADAMAKQAAGAGNAKFAAQVPEDQFKIQVQDDLFFNASATLIWPIFTGGKIFSAYKASTENVDAQKSAFSMAENSILSQVCGRYFTMRLAEEMVALRTDALNTIQVHADQAKKLEEGGQISRAERLRAEVALVEAMTEKDNAERDLSLARLALANSLGSNDTALVATTPITTVAINGSLEDYKSRATQNYPGIKQLEQEKKRAGRAVTAARGDYFPTVALFGKKELYTKDLTILEPEWAVGVAVEWNIFHGGETVGKVAEAKSQEREVESLEHQAVQNISLLVEKRFREYEHAKSQLETLSKTEELAKESLEDQQKAFNAGMGTSLSVVDAELSLERLRVATLKANYDAMMALVGLLETCGEVEKIGQYLENQK
ncbi:MAG: TolC family protein [Hallerella porci]|uniref:TolC family protein n=1 Tax=Hallerella TaxID=2815788 RepID=UPI000D063876|nr:MULTISPECIES: TolC family protein [Hallerella]MCI5599968.1 TolC family protein [Hallerella sp.]MDY3921948.1 TolC family protein [Hallerella porci]